jgi:hypothetical protein
MAIWDKVKQGIDKAGKAAQDVFDEGKLRIDAYRAREQADKAAEALGYAVFRAWENNAELDADARERLAGALRTRENEARKLENELAEAKANEAKSSGSSEPAAEPPAATPPAEAPSAAATDGTPPL